MHGARSPAAGRETLDEDTREVERILLGARVRGGLVISELPAPARSVVAGLISDGLVDGAAAIGGRLTLTVRGRLLADAVVRQLLVV